MRAFGGILAGIIGLPLFLAGGLCVYTFGDQMGPGLPTLDILTAIGVFGGGGLLFLAYILLQKK